MTYERMYLVYSYCNSKQTRYVITLGGDSAYRTINILHFHLLYKLSKTLFSPPSPSPDIAPHSFQPFSPWHFSPTPHDPRCCAPAPSSPPAVPSPSPPSAPPSASPITAVVSCAPFLPSFPPPFLLSPPFPSTLPPSPPPFRPPSLTPPLRRIRKSCGRNRAFQKLPAAKPKGRPRRVEAGAVE